MADNFVGDAWVVIRPDLSKFTAELGAGVTESIAKVQAIADAKPIHLSVQLDTSAAMAQLAALSAAGAASGGGDRGGAIVPVPTGAGGGGGGGVLGTLGFGAGLFGFAGIFTAASLAGLGFEHVLTTAIGLAGSLAGAIGGALLLAIGAAGVAFVGMGSDAAVMKSVITDTKTLYGLLTALQTAVLQYGANSSQAAAAQAALNVQVQMLGNTAGVAAELALAKSVQAMNMYWDKATSGARVAAVAILQQFVGVANIYIPLIADAAQRNFNIILANLKPLIDYLSGPATGIFKHLEDIFAKNLPTAIDAFTQGIEFVLRTVDFLSGYTGGFTKAIDDLLKKANSPDGFAKWEGIMTTLIGMFRDWWGFVKELGKVLYDLFSQSLGLGTAIITTITGMLKQLDAWLQSSSGKNAVHTLFAVHLQEVLALLGLLPGLLSAFSNLYLTIAPPLTLLVAGLATMVGWMVKVPVVGPLLAWGLAIAFLASKLKLLALFAVIGDLYALGSAFVVFAGEEGIAAAATATFGGVLAVAFAPVTLIVAALVILGAAMYLLVTHFKTVSDFLGGPWGTAISAGLAVIFPFIGIPALIIGHWQAIWDFLHAVPGWFADAFRAVVGAGTTLVNWFKTLPDLIWNAVVGFFKGLGGDIVNAIGDLGSLLWSIGANLMWGLWHGISSVWDRISGFIKSIPGDIASWFKGIFGISSPSRVFHEIGVSLMEGLNNGLKAGLPKVMGTLNDVSGSLTGALGGRSLRYGTVGGGGPGAVVIYQTINANGASRKDVEDAVARGTTALKLALRTL